MHPAVSLSEFLILLLSCSEAHVAIKGSYPPGCHLDTSSSLLTVDCRGEDIVGIPSGLPNNTQVLNIWNGNIATLKKQSFMSLTSLIKLRIISSNVKTIQPGAFSELQELEELNLYDSCAKLSYEAGVFKGLQRLKYLNLQESQCSSYKYPDDDVFSDIPSVKELHIFGLGDKALSTGFSKLRNLTSLVISGNEGCCYFNHLNNSTFRSLSELTIRHLNISHCHLKSVEPFTFASLSKLYSLSINFQFLRKLEHVLNVMNDVRNMPIEFLNMNNVSWGYKDFTFGRDLLIPLKHTPLKELHMESNRMSWIEADFENALPKSIETLSLANNYFMGDRLAIIGLFFLHNLTSLTLSIFETKWGNMERGVPIPLHLTSLHLSNTNVKLVPETLFQMPNSLHSLTWTDSTVPEFRGYIKGLNMLKTLQLTHINCRNISNGYFQFLTSLNTLKISNNYLGDVISANENGGIFRNLQNLDVLDLSSNDIKTLPFLLFKDLKNLTRLYLSRNSLRDWGVDISHLTRLAYIDLSGNAIKSLNAQAMNDFGRHFSVYNATINLTNNHFECSCYTHNFIKWMQRGRKHFSNFETYYCQYLNITLSLGDGLTTLDQVCADFGVVISLTSVIIFIITTLITGLIVYKYRNLLLYIYYSMRRVKHDRFARRDDYFVFDAFISYAEEDLTFVKNKLLPVCEEQYNLKLCINDRNFMPGAYVTENICNAVHFSRKTVILMTSSYLNSELCMFEYTMARTEQIITGRDVLLFIDYKNVPNEHLSLDMMERRSCAGLEYPERREHIIIFWERLTRDIRSKHM